MLKDIKGIGPKSLSLLNKLGIHDTSDLLEFYPFRYDLISRSDLSNLNSDKVIIDGVIETNPSLFYFNKKMNKLSFRLNTGEYILNVSIFNRGFLKNNLRIGTKVTVIGKIDNGLKNIVASDIMFGLILKDTILPVYHTTYGITGRQIKALINNAIETEFEVNDYLPNEIINRYNFINKKEAILELHNPTSDTKLKQSLHRMKYEELFMFMVKMNDLKNNKKNKIGLKREVDHKLVEELINNLPFKLTSDQLKSIEDIYSDLTEPKRMNRLLQGDVGSGKTIVSIVAMYINYLSGYQSALLAPTEILANQHYKNIKSLLSKYNINVELLTGKLKVKEKREIYEKLKNKDIDIIIGTHALFTDDVEYNNLGLVITDEQHRFGVNQRSSLKNKGVTPDILYMSATPIPRTYALTLYGDMDISSIKTIPSGRKEIKTTLKKESEMKDVLTSMFEELKKGHQIYVVAPLIEESDSIDLENVNELEEKMNRAFSKYYKVGIMHGRMSSTEKDEVMKKFVDNDIQILISTTVIEVGIDVSNATMIVIFDSFRFGLSALHQLRGRVGRNSLDSYCILISNYETERLNILTKTNDGFKISEEDFLLRGSGDIFGVKQSGINIFKLADLKNDYDLLLQAKEDSLNYLNSEAYKENNKLQELLKSNGDLD